MLVHVIFSSENAIQEMARNYLRQVDELINDHSLSSYHTKDPHLQSVTVTKVSE
jgi:hypothetical protein